MQAQRWFAWIYHLFLSQCCLVLWHCHWLVKWNQAPISQSPVPVEGDFPLPCLIAAQYILWVPVQFVFWRVANDFWWLSRKAGIIWHQIPLLRNSYCQHQEENQI